MRRVVGANGWRGNVTSGRKGLRTYLLVAVFIFQSVAVRVERLALRWVREETGSLQAASVGLA